MNRARPTNHPTATKPTNQQTKQLTSRLCPLARGLRTRYEAKETRKVPIFEFIKENFAVPANQYFRDFLPLRRFIIATSAG